MCVCVCLAPHVCVSFWPRQQNQSRMTPFPQIPLFSLVKHGKTYSNSPPLFPPSCFLRISHVLWVPALLDQIWPFLLPWVCGVQKVCGQKQERFPSRSQFTGAFGGRRTTENNSGALFLFLWLGLTQGAMLHVFFPVHLILPAFPSASIPCNFLGVTASRWCAS